MKKASICLVSWAVCLFFICSFHVFAAAEQTEMPPAAAALETIYAIDPQNQTYHIIPYGKWETVRDALTLPVLAQVEDSAAKDRGGFCFVAKDGTRTIYTITEKQVLLGDQPLTVTSAARSDLIKLCDSLRSAAPAAPALLAYFSLDTLHSVAVEGNGATSGRVDPEKRIDSFTASMQGTPITEKNRATAVARLMKSIRVQPNQTERLAQSADMNDTSATLRVKITLDSAVTYHCAITPAALTLSSTDGITTYRYPFAGYEATSPGTGDGWRLLEAMWDLYAGSTLYTDFALLQTTKAGEHTSGAFYAQGSSQGAKLSLLLESAIVTPYDTATGPQKDTYLTIYGRERATGATRCFLFDSSYTLYFNDATGKTRAVSMGQEAWRAARDLVTGGEPRDRLMLLEKDSGEVTLIPLDGKESFLAPLFSPLPKNPAKKAYNTGALPDYAQNAIDCWRDLGKGNLTCTTVYPAVLVQQSNRLPWTPALYDASMLYTLLEDKF